MTQQYQKAITKVLEESRRKLLDTGARNRLIHVNRGNVRSNSLNIINERADEIYSLLRVQAKRMRFKALGKDKTNSSEDMLLAVAEENLPEDSGRLSDSILETPLGPEALARRLLRLAGNAKTSEEEQGINILYLAIGFLQWRESASSEVVREAPLILLPVQLVRNQRTSTYDILCRDDEITTNLPLSERLRIDFGIALPEIEENEQWQPSVYFNLVSEAVCAKAQWSIDTDGMQLGFYSFAKLLMHQDLDPDNWPEAAFVKNPLLNGLLIDGFADDTPLFSATDKLDEKLDPAQLIQVIDADASQTKVIEEVRSGASLVVQGPPGTGKSQTITNIIAAAVHDGKSVLFVAEKMAALSVVHERLVKAGLRDICLELHSRCANKKMFAQELGRTLSASAVELPGEEDAIRLRDTRDKLNRLTALLHQPLPQISDTPYSTLAEIIGFIGNDTPPPSIPLDALELLNVEERETASDAIKAYITCYNRVGDPNNHPFSGTAELDLQPTDLDRLAMELTTAQEYITSFVDDACHSASATGQPEPSTLRQITVLIAGLELLAQAPADAAVLAPVLFRQPGDDGRLYEALAVGRDWAQAHQSASERFTDAAWSADVSALRVVFVRAQTSWLTRLLWGYRRASAELATLLSGPLPKLATERLALVDELIKVQSLRCALADEQSWLKDRLAAQWRGERTPFSRLLAGAEWFALVAQRDAFASASEVSLALGAVADPAAAAKQLTAGVADCQSVVQKPLTRLKLAFTEATGDQTLEDIPLLRLSERFQRMAGSIEQYIDWADYIRSEAQAVDCRAESIVAGIKAGTIDTRTAEQVFAYACAEARWQYARKVRPELNELARQDRHQLVRLFCELERYHIETAKSRVLAQHAESLPRGTAGEMGIIRGEIARKRGHKPIRWLLSHAGAMVQRIKPVMLMSPISVAQFLPPGSVTFDLLVIDEASQVRPEDALGVIARADQIVVVGDQQQLPPTSFFDRLVDTGESDDDEETLVPPGANVADMESILSLCEARGLRQRMLEWHYRSRDSSLIQVSNAEFYNDGLVLPPSPLQLDIDYGLKFSRVAGVYARAGSGLGRKGTNLIEAEAIAKAVAAHAREWPDLSLGVVAFSKSQADMLTEVLELQRRKDPVLEAFLREGKAEDVFVKNIENVQGDERDVILISVGYGPQTPNGQLSAMHFGPINMDGGERRLNVLFSRARIRCEVFASFDPGDIDTTRVKRAGPRVLKRFLEFAKTGVMETAIITGAEADSPFEQDVARVIESLGYLADPQVGSAGFRIDIGVRHPAQPGQYLVAVECDGAAYHSALWARERDRLRQGILENLGWHFHRIWSTDWFYHRSREIERLEAALGAAAVAAQNGIRVTGANLDSAAAAPSEMLPPGAEEPADIAHLVLKAPAYERADLSVDVGLQPHEVPQQQLADLVTAITEIEGPIHEEELARRVASTFGLARAGRRIIEATHSGIKLASGDDGVLKQAGPFVLTESQLADPPVRDRSGETGRLLKADYLPPLEIAVAARQVVNESGNMSAEELTRAVARLLGFQRVGPDLFEVIGKVVEKLPDLPVLDSQ